MRSNIFQNNTFFVALSVVLLAAVSYLDHVSGHLITFSALYLLPITLVTWFVGREAGVVMASGAILLWIAVDYLTMPPPYDLIISLWNAVMLLSFFSVIVLLLARLKVSLELERRLSHLDFLTGIANRHDLEDLLALEMERARRHERPLSVCYINCDHFKKLNETQGRAQGDLLLKEVANVLSQHTRKIDKAARLKDDIFAVILPETNETQAREITLRLHVKLLTVMELYRWPVTFSAGVVSFTDMPLTGKDALEEAEQMMCQAKRNGGNQLVSKTIRSIIRQAGRRWS